jgi:integrase
VRLTYIHTVTKGGRTYRYLRLPGQMAVALPNLPLDHPDFLTAYAAAKAGAARIVRAAPGTIAALVEAFLRSARFAELSPAYRNAVRREAEEIRKKAGAGRAADLRARHIRADLLDLDPHRSTKRLKAWRLICAHGLAIGMLTDDPSEGIRRQRLPRSEGHAPWTDDDIAAFRRRWPLGTVQRKIMEVLLWTGARISDAVTLGPGMVSRDGVLSYRQAKTGRIAYVPWTCALPTFAQGREAMHEALAALPSGQMTFLATAQGRTRSAKAIGGLVSEAAIAAGLTRKSAHGLRKTRATRLAEAGATTHAIAAWTGHTTLTEVQRYTASADRRRVVMGTEDDRDTVNLAVQFTNGAENAS